MDIFHPGDDIPRSQIVIFLHDMGAFSNDREIHFGHFVRQKCSGEEAERLLSY